MNLLEESKLRFRALKYTFKDDVGGVAYLKTAIQKGQTVLDVGAHKAAYLYLMQKRVGKNGHVFAFEPQRELFAFISNLKEHCHWQNVTVEHLALSNSAGTAGLYIPDNKVSKGSSPGASLLKKEVEAAVVKIEHVNTDTLDAYCKRKNIQPHFIKIDVEGNELNVFKGGVATLSNCKPKLLVEIEARHVGQESVLETFSFLQSLGYQGSFILGSKRTNLSDFRFEKHQNRSDLKNYCNNFIFE